MSTLNVGNVISNQVISGIISATNQITSNQYDISFFTPILNAAYGSNPVTGSFTLSKKSTCIFSFSGSAYRTSAGLMNLVLSVTGSGNIGTTTVYTNETFSHKCFPTSFASRVLTPGTYTVSLTISTSYDSADYGNCSVLAIPTN
jgi:hypothetical protein